MFNSLEVSNKQAAVPDHLKSDVLRGMREAKSMLRRAFVTKNTHTFGVIGADWNGIDCMLSAVLPSDKVIVFVNRTFSGINGLESRVKALFGSDFTADDHSTIPDNVVIIDTPHGKPITGDIVDAALATYRPKWAMMAHKETESGCINDIEGFSDACLKHNAMGLVDMVSLLGIADFSIDDYPGVVAWASCPQFGPLSYAPVSLTDKYIGVIKQRGVYSYRHHPLLQAAHWGVIDGKDSIAAKYCSAHSQQSVSEFHEVLRVFLKHGQGEIEERFTQPVAA
ncbi:MAG: hypothetical protein ACPG47_12285 [Leucothrix sp.]